MEKLLESSGLWHLFNFRWALSRDRQAEQESVELIYREVKPSREHWLREDDDLSALKHAVYAALSTQRN